MKKKGYLCCKKEIAPLKDYYAQKPRHINNQLAREKSRKAYSNYGVAFLYFKNQDSLIQFKKNFSDMKSEMKNKLDATMYKELNISVRYHYINKIRVGK